MKPWPDWVEKLYHTAGQQGRWYRSHYQKGKDRHHRKGRKGSVGIVGQPDIFTANQICDGFNRKKNIVADDHTYTEARIYRRAQFSVNRGAESYPINSFINFISHSAITLDQFPTNAILAERIRQVPATVLEYLKDTLAKKLTFSTMKGVTKEQIDGLRTSCVLSCSGSVALFGQTDYTLIVTEQGSKQVRQELIQGTDSHYVRTYNGAVWGAWTQQTETAMHLDVKITGTRVYVRHGALGEDCDLVLLRKKKRSRWRATGGAKAYSKNRGIRKKRTAKTQYVYFKGIKLSKGTPGNGMCPNV